MTPTSFRLSDDDLARLRRLAQPGESRAKVISRALVALEGHQSPQDGAAAPTHYAGMGTRVDASETGLEARVSALEAWQASLATAPQPVAPPAIPVVQPVVHPVVQKAIGVVQPVVQNVAQPWVYPLEVKRLALAMQANGQPNRVIAGFILRETGRKPDSKNMGALLKNWRKALGSA